MPLYDAPVQAAVVVPLDVPPVEPTVLAPPPLEVRPPVTELPGELVPPLPVGFALADGATN